MTQGAILAFDTGPGFALSADLLAGDFSIFADASLTVLVNNNFSGMFRPVEFTNDTRAAVTIAAGAIRVSVHANFSHRPAQGGAHNTNMRTGGRARVLDSYRATPLPVSRRWKMSACKTRLACSAAAATWRSSKPCNPFITELIKPFPPNPVVHRFRFALSRRGPP